CQQPILGTPCLAPPSPEVEWVLLVVGSTRTSGGVLIDPPCTFAGALEIAINLNEGLSQCRAELGSQFVLDREPELLSDSAEFVRGDLHASACHGTHRARSISTEIAVIMSAEACPMLDRSSAISSMDRVMMSRHVLAPAGASYRG